MHFQNIKNIALPSSNNNPLGNGGPISAKRLKKVEGKILDKKGGERSTLNEVQHKNHQDFSPNDNMEDETSQNLLFIMFQALMPFAASPTFGFLYRSTVETTPQAFIYMVIGIYFVLLSIIFVVHFWTKKSLKSEKETMPVK